MGKIDSKTGIFPLSYTWELDTTLIKVMSKDITFLYCICVLAVHVKKSCSNFKRNIFL